MSASLRSRGRVPSRQARFAIFFLSAVVAAAFAHTKPAYALGTCGDVDCNGSVSASDALAVLKKAVGGSAVVACPSNCGNGMIASIPTDAVVMCGDFNCTSSVTASDALSVLKAAVGVSVDLKCGLECPGVSTTTSTTLPPASDEQAAVLVVSSVRAAANLYGIPTDAQNIHKLKRLAAYTSILVDSDSAGTLSLLGDALDDLATGATDDIDLSGCVTFGSGSVSFDNCNIGFGGTFDGSVGGSGNTFTLDVDFTVVTPFGTTTITMNGTITTTTSAVTGTLTIVTSTTSGQSTSTSTVTETFDVGIANECPTSGTVTTSYHVVEMNGSTTTRDDENSFTSTFGPNCGDVGFVSQTTTTVSTTTTTLGGQSQYAPGALEIIKGTVEILDLAGGELNGDKLEDAAVKVVDNAGLLGGLDSVGILQFVATVAGGRDNVVQPPDPGCMTHVGNTTTFTNCSIDFNRLTFNGTLVLDGDAITVDLHGVDGAQHTRDNSGTITVTSTSLSGTLSTVSIQPGANPSSITYDTRTTVEFDVDLQSGHACGGTLHVPYDNKAFLGAQLVNEKTGDYGVTFGPACNQVTFN